MYWIYLVLFVAIVFVPDFVRRGLWGLSMTTTQELFLFFFGLLSFVLYLIREQQLSRFKQEKAKNQRSVNQLTKDLTTSYSYIGETNRKLEILKTISLGIPDGGEITSDREREMFHSIVDAVQVLTKSNKVILRFKREHVGIVRELKSNDKVLFNFSAEKERMQEEGLAYIENEEHAIFASQRSADGTKAFLIVLKDVSHRTIEDVDIMKTLVTYALFMHVYCQANRPETEKTHLIDLPKN